MPGSDPDKDKISVVAARCIDMAAPTAKIDKAHCSVCGEWVWLSPSWREKKIDCIFCEPCFKKRNHADDNFIVDEQALDAVVKSIQKRYGYSAAKIKSDMLKYVEKKFGKKVKVQKIK